LWRFVTAALDPTAAAAWLPALILALLAAHWTIAAWGRAREQQGRSATLQAHKAAAYRRALTDSDGWSDLALWGSIEVLRRYSDYQRARADDPAVPVPGELLAEMRRDLGLRSEGLLDPNVLALVLHPPLAQPPATRPGSPSGPQVNRPTFFSP
jgi:hypothetical protein